MRPMKSSRRPSDSRAQQAYANYLGYCERIGVKPLSFEQWQAQDKPLLPNFDSPRYGFGDK